MNNSLYVIAPLSAIGKRPRLAKMAHFFESHEMNTIFLGWERIKNESSNLRWKGNFIKEKIIMKGGGYANSYARMLYPIWMIVVFTKILFLPKGSKCWCLGWETAFPARVASIFSRCEIIFDDADRFSMVLKLPTPLQRLLIKLEIWTSKNCKKHVIPGWTRYEWKNTNMTLLRNSPMKADYEQALLTPHICDTNILTVYVNGWIAWDTGAHIILKALRELEHRGIEIKIIVAGRVVSEEGLKLLKHPSVEFKGALPQSEALKLYRHSHLTLTLYDPSVEINHHAESNKWGDCVVLGVPFIVNKEVLTAQKFVNMGCAFDFEYKNYIGLADLLENLSANKTQLKIASDALKFFSEEYIPFENQLENIFHDLKAE